MNDQKSGADYLTDINDSPDEKSGVVDHMGSLSRHDVVLEIGPGGASPLELIAARAFKMNDAVRPKIVVLDLSDQVLCAVRALMDSLNAEQDDGGVDYALLKADTTALPLRSNSVAAINASSVVHECFSYCGGQNGLQAFASEAARVLQPNGVLAYRDPDGIELKRSAESILKTPEIRSFMVLFLKKYFDEKFTSFNKCNMHYLDGLSLSLDGVNVPVAKLQIDQVLAANEVLIKCDSGLMHELKRHFVVFISTYLPGAMARTTPVDGGKLMVKFFKARADEHFSHYCAANNHNYDHLDDHFIVDTSVYEQYKASIADEFAGLISSPTLEVENEKSLRTLESFLTEAGIAYESGEGNQIILAMSDLVVIYQSLSNFLAERDISLNLNKSAKKIANWFSREGEESYFYGDQIDVIASFLKSSMKRDAEDSALGYSCLIPMSGDASKFVARSHYTGYVADNVDDVIGTYSDGKRHIHFVKRPIEYAIPVLLDLYKKSSDNRIGSLIKEIIELIGAHLQTEAPINAIGERELGCVAVEPSVYGLVGGIASGKTSVANVFEGEGFAIVELSDAIRDRIGELGINEPTRTDYFNVGNDLRRNGGNDALARLATAKVINGNPTVINGIRTPEEVAFLRRTYADFCLIGLDVPLETRIQRIKMRLRDIDATDRDRVVADIEREWKDISEGCQLGATMALVDRYVPADLPLDEMEASCLALIRNNDKLLT